MEKSCNNAVRLHKSLRGPSRQVKQGLYCHHKHNGSVCIGARCPPATCGLTTPLTPPRSAISSGCLALSNPDCTRANYAPDTVLSRSLTCLTWLTSFSLVEGFRLFLPIPPHLCNNASLNREIVSISAVKHVSSWTTNEDIISRAAQ
jgi:hypothetical protein